MCAIVKQENLALVCPYTNTTEIPVQNKCYFQACKSLDEYHVIYLQ